MAEVAAEMSESGMAIDDQKSTASGKLTKVYDKGGKKFGVIEVTMELVVTKLASGRRRSP